MCAAVKKANPNANFGHDGTAGCRTWYYPGRDEPLLQNSCQNWVQYTTRMNIPFVEIEPMEQSGNFTWHPERDLCTDDFTYMVTLRDPITRLHSHLCQHAIDVSYVLNSSRTYCFGDASICSPIAFDNFYIRSILGPPVSNLPVGSITEEHLEHAAAILEQFHVVVIFERPESWRQVQQLPILKGASIEHIATHTTSNATSNANPCETLPTKSQFLHIARMNHLDQRLYKFAVQLSEHRSSEHGDVVLFQSGASGG
jgi:hypothetical protein